MTVNQLTTRPFDLRSCIGAFGAPLASVVVSTLAETEERMARQIAAPDDPWLSEAAGYLLRAGGKRLRPLLVILAGHTGKPDRDRLVRAAIAVELVHVATLHHDDVMDGATLRHGVPSANLVWGNRMAVYLGDYLMAIASETALGLGTEFVRRQGATLTRLVRGQAMEGMPLQAGETAVDQYLKVASDKSAALFGWAGWAGALCGDAGEGAAEALATYGEALGVAFQISDDLIDIVADPTTSGKTAGIDLQKGVRTLPILRALAAGDSTAERLSEIVAGGGVEDPALRTEALELLRSSAAVAQTYDDLQRHADVAQASLGRLPDCQAREALQTLGDFIVRRAY